MRELAATGPTGASGLGPSMGRRRLLQARAARRCSNVYWAFRRSPASPDHLALTATFALLGVTWTTPCGHESGFTRGWPPYFKRCAECGQYGWTRHRFGRRHA